MERYISEFKLMIVKLYKTGYLVKDLIVSMVSPISSLYDNEIKYMKQEVLSL